MREIVFDTETTGLQPRNGDRLTEIGCIEVIDYIPTGRTYHTLINPERDIPAEVTKVTGHTREMLRNEPLFADVVDDFLSFVGDDRLVAHNASFDRGFINAELERARKSPYPDERFVDTLVMARKAFPGAYNSLDALCKRFNISLDTREKHGALIDAKLLADVYLELNGGRERRFDLGDGRAAADTAHRPLDRPVHGPRPTPLAVRLTPQEEAAHAAFLDTFKTPPLWRSARRG